eukprot:TRINITY_DN66489_c8_g1_i2.p1 TRINITY_DN66489_c8_g1~~TRINITY_DN66489_c8_g1_i2.p1  ORF type:complete len:441 (-),score=100.34 TRINITY_DN66489_c8_g1_i2:47-1369(-)
MFAAVLGSVAGSIYLLRAKREENHRDNENSHHHEEDPQLTDDDNRIVALATHCEDDTTTHHLNDTTVCGAKNTDEEDNSSSGGGYVACGGNSQQQSWLYAATFCGAAATASVTTGAPPPPPPPPQQPAAPPSSTGGGTARGGVQPFAAPNNVIWKEGTVGHVRPHTHTTTTGGAVSACSAAASVAELLPFSSQPDLLDLVSLPPPVELFRAASQPFPLMRDMPNAADNDTSSWLRLTLTAQQFPYASLNPEEIYGDYNLLNDVSLYLFLQQTIVITTTGGGTAGGCSAAPVVTSSVTTTNTVAVELATGDIEQSMGGGSFTADSFGQPICKVVFDLNSGDENVVVVHGFAQDGTAGLPDDTLFLTLGGNNNNTTTSSQQQKKVVEVEVGVFGFCKDTSNPLAVAAEAATIGNNGGGGALATFCLEHSWCLPEKSKETITW